MYKLFDCEYEQAHDAYLYGEWGFSDNSEFIGEFKTKKECIREAKKENLLVYKIYNDASIIDIEYIFDFYSFARFFCQEGDARKKLGCLLCDRDNNNKLAEKANTANLYAQNKNYDDIYNKFITIDENTIKYITNTGEFIIEELQQRKIKLKYHSEKGFSNIFNNDINPPNTQLIKCRGMNKKFHKN